MNQNQLLGTEKVSRLLVSLAVPAITAQIVNMLYNIVDRIYIGHIPEIGHLALSGVGITLPVIMLITAFSNLIGMGGAPLASIKMGQQKNEDAEKIVGNCFVLLLALAVILTAVFLYFSEPMLYLFGASEATIGYGTDYMNIYVVGTIFVLLALGLNPFISAQGFAKISMYTTIIGAAFNIVLDPIFIFGLDMGVKGAALATVISQGISAVWVMRFLTGKKTVLKIKKINTKLVKSIIFPVLALGLSPFIMMSTESLLSIAFNTSLQKYGGDIAVGAMTVITSLMQMCMLPMQGLAQGAQPIISYNYGAGDMKRVNEAFRMLFRLTVAFSTIFCILTVAFPGIFVSIFASDASLKEMASWGLRIYMAGVFMIGVQTSCQQTFIALGQAKISLFLALLRKMILLIPLIYILPMFFEDKLLAVFLAEPVSDIIAATTTLILFRKTLKKITMDHEGV